MIVTCKVKQQSMTLLVTNEHYFLLVYVFRYGYSDTCVVSVSTFYFSFHVGLSYRLLNAMSFPFSTFVQLFSFSLCFLLVLVLITVSFYWNLHCYASQGLSSYLQEKKHELVLDFIQNFIAAYLPDHSRGRHIFCAFVIPSSFNHPL